MTFRRYILIPLLFNIDFKPVVLNPFLVMPDLSILMPSLGHQILIIQKVTSYSCGESLKGY